MTEIVSNLRVRERLQEQQTMAQEPSSVAEKPPELATTGPDDGSSQVARPPVIRREPAGRPSGTGDRSEPRADAHSPAATEEADRAREEPHVSGLSFLIAAPSWLSSMLVHIILVIVLALWTYTTVKEVPPELFSDPSKIKTALEEVTADELPEQVSDQLDEPQQVLDAIASNVDVASEDISQAFDDQAAAVQVELSDIGLDTAPRTDLLATAGALTGDALSGRGEANRSRIAMSSGASKESEAAVAMGLDWLARHQNADGSWSFDHRGGPCQNRCRDAGSMGRGRLAATGMALMPFLGAGNTHKEGKYKDNVRMGLYYLVGNMQVGPNGGGLNGDGGRMYGHGIASIALCEAYAMSRDKALATPAQQAVKFICTAQDPVGGGWRYEPRTPGDTSVVGWQIMALKSAHLAYLVVPPNTIRGAEHFLNSVQADGGTYYGYTGPGQGQATTAIGLLCRMHLGWKREHPALEKGVTQLSKWGPSQGNMYFNYYATQVMRHYEGEPWTKWNAVMRDQLVKAQNVQQKSHENGSWYFKDGDHGADQGGRVYCTSMAVMTLEVYYRHMPIYQSESAQTDFND
jgi:hypothetical protein